MYPGSAAAGNIYNPLYDRRRDTFDGMDDVTLSFSDNSMFKDEEMYNNNQGAGKRIGAGSSADANLSSSFSGSKGT
jgi:hypothetical protein